MSPQAHAEADKRTADALREAAAGKAKAYNAADDELAKVTNPLAQLAA